MPLVCFDPKAGTLRRYERRGKAVVSTGVARFDPWADLPILERVVSLDAVEAFRLLPTTALEPTAA